MKLADRKDRRRACYTLAAMGHVRITETDDGQLELRLPPRPDVTDAEQPEIHFEPFSGYWRDRYTGRDGWGFLSMAKALGLSIGAALAAINTTMSDEGKS